MPVWVWVISNSICLQWGITSSASVGKGKTGTVTATYPITFNSIYRSIATSCSNQIANWIMVSSTTSTVTVDIYISADASTKTCQYNYFSIGSKS